MDRPHSDVSVRPARARDREFVVAVAARFADFGPPPWRSAGEVVEGEARTLRAFFDGALPRAELLIAEGAEQRPMGFLFLERHRDYFSLEEYGHIGMIAVAAEAEGLGAGAALMRAAERWARQHGFRRLTLNVFEHNTRARRVYEHFGFVPDTIRYIKTLDR
jgi:ribosomal protein S18 acetylase RimI-like enzyme